RRDRRRAAPERSRATLSRPFSLKRGKTMQWKRAISAITTPFKPDLSVDHAFLAEHAAWQLSNGVDGIVALGSLGEAATLTFDEKGATLRALCGVMKGKPLVAGIASLSTSEAIALAKAAQDAGCN